MGQITGLRRTAGVWTLTVDGGPVTAAVQPGDSLAVSGICLTVTGHDGDRALVQAMEETRRRTTLAAWRPGLTVNLEQALAAGDRIGGHLVTGHVDGVGRVLKVTRTAGSIRHDILAPADCAGLIRPRGSVAIDGVSLTVAQAAGRTFTVNLIPETAARTTLRLCRPGTLVNVEADILARYGRVPVSAIQGGA